VTGHNQEAVHQLSDRFVVVDCWLAVCICHAKIPALIDLLFAYLFLNIDEYLRVVFYVRYSDMASILNFKFEAATEGFMM